MKTMDQNHTHDIAMQIITLLKEENIRKKQGKSVWESLEQMCSYDIVAQWNKVLAAMIGKEETALNEVDLNQMNNAICMMLDSMAAGIENRNTRAAELEKHNLELISWAKELEEAKALFERRYLEKDAQVAELIEWANKLTESKEFFEKQCKEKDAQVAELIQWSAKLKEDKEFFEKQYKEKDAQAAELISWADKLTAARDFYEAQMKQKEEQLQRLSDENREQENTIAKLKFKLNMLLNDSKIQKIIDKKQYEI